MTRTDEQLIADYVATRSQDAATELTYRYWPLVVGFLAKRTTTGDAEDLAQEVFAKVFSRCEMFDPAKSLFKGWLFTIAENVFRDAYRKKRRRPVLAIHEDTEPIDENLSAECAAETHDLIVRIWAMVGELPEAEQQAMRLRFSDGLSRRQAAKASGMPGSSLQQRATRVLERLRERLA